MAGVQKWTTIPSQTRPIRRYTWYQTKWNPIWRWFATFLNPWISTFGAFHCAHDKEFFCEDSMLPICGKNAIFCAEKWSQALSQFYRLLFCFVVVVVAVVVVVVAVVVVVVHQMLFFHSQGFVISNLVLPIAIYFKENEALLTLTQCCLSLWFWSSKIVYERQNRM